MKNKQKAQEVEVQHMNAPVMRSTAGLQEALFEELDKLRNGHSNATNANAFARVAGEIGNILNIEVEVAKLKVKGSAEGPKALMLEPIKLGEHR